MKKPQDSPPLAQASLFSASVFHSCWPHVSRVKNTRAIWGKPKHKRTLAPVRDSVLRLIIKLNLYDNINLNLQQVQASSLEQPIVQARKLGLANYRKFIKHKKPFDYSKIF